MSFPHWLATLEQAELANLIDRRPDVLRPPAPHDLTELSERLQHPASLAPVVNGLTLPQLQVLRAVMALGYHTTTTTLAGILDSGQSPTAAQHGERVLGILEGLTGVAVVWRRDDEVAAPMTLQMLLGPELGLAPPLVQHLMGLNRDRLRQIQRRLGLAVSTSKADAMESVHSHLSDPQTLRAVLDTAPRDVMARLAEIVALNYPGYRTDPGPPDPFEDDEDNEVTARHDLESMRRTSEAVRWGGERGLVHDDPYEYSYWIPSEVVLALQDKDFRLGFTSTPPMLVQIPVEARLVETESTAAATAFAGQALGLLDGVARAGIARLKSGGVGARETGRLAKSIGAAEPTTRLILELSGYAGLLVPEGSRVVVSPGFAGWREASPSERLGALLAAWWQLADVPTASLDGTGKTLPALRPEGACPLCRAARHTALALLGGLDGAASTRESLAQAVSWHAPMSHGNQDAAGNLTLIWGEAETLGVVAAGALTELGRRLLAEDWDAVASRLAELLPPSTDRATFGSDLTAIVAGSPSARVTALLDSCAVREGRGGATLWRFTTGSIRAALDTGAPADGLQAELTAIAANDLPQPLTYLLRDVARRHGLLRTASAATTVRCDDAALLAEVAHDRRLARLGLRPLAPTVLASDAPEDEVLEALRKAGYFPMPTAAGGPSEAGAGRGGDAGSDTGTDPGAGPTRHERTLTSRALLLESLAHREPGRQPHAALSRDELAERLVGRLTSEGGGARSTETEAALLDSGARVSRAEVRRLAHAIDRQDAVVIDYVNQTGGTSRRRIRDIVFFGGRLYAFCELRQGDREFVVRNILSVHPD